MENTKFYPAKDDQIRLLTGALENLISAINNFGNVNNAVFNAATVLALVKCEDYKKWWPGAVKAATDKAAGLPWDVSPQQAAGVPDDVPAWAIPLVKFAGPSAKDMAIFFQALAQQGVTPKQAAQETSLIAEFVKNLKVAPAGATINISELAKKFHNMGKDMGQVAAEHNARVKIFWALEDYKARIKAALPQCIAEKKNCPLCSKGRWCEKHVRKSLSMQAQEKIAQQSDGQALIDFINSQTAEDVKKAYEDYNWRISHGYPTCTCPPDYEKGSIRIGCPVHWEKYRLTHCTCPGWRHKDCHFHGGNNCICDVKEGGQLILRDGCPDHVISKTCTCPDPAHQLIMANCPMHGGKNG